MNNVMIDIETLSTAANSVIMSIGAVAFDADGLHEEFYAVVNIDSCVSLGLTVEGKTIAWWLDQGIEARAIFLETGLPLPSVLKALAGAFVWKDTLLWCNGLAFDLPILDSAYRACGMSVPWAYYNGRDYRTIKNEISNEAFNLLRVEPRVEHHALEDAKAQALTLNAIRNYQADPIKRMNLMYAIP